LYHRVSKIILKNAGFLFYLNLGWEHIISLDALDHQLFVLALIAVYSFSDLKKF
jgi:hypothetical protein